MRWRWQTRACGPRNRDLAAAVHGARLSEAIDRYRCTWLTAVPPMIAMMLRDRRRLAATDLSSVEFVRMGSAPVSHSLMAAIHATLPRAAVTNAYGTTEAGPVVFGRIRKDCRSRNCRSAIRIPGPAAARRGDNGNPPTPACSR